MKPFIAVTAETYLGKLVLINTSLPDKKLFNIDGISTKEAIEFLYSLRHLKKRKEYKRAVFVCYAASSDNEFIFSGLDCEVKDRLFQSYQIRNQIDQLQNEKECCEDIKFSTNKSEDEKESARDRIEAINKKLKYLSTPYAGDYKLALANGKKITITKEKTSLVIYDICSFFDKQPIRDAAIEWLNEDVPYLQKETAETIKNYRVFDTQKMLCYSDIEALYIARLASVLEEKLDIELELYAENFFYKGRINIRGYYGPSSITSFFLSKANAKSEYHNYKTQRSLSPELYHAVRQAYYGGRSEQFKIGKIDQPIHVYDLNSAYAYAATFLPKMLKKPVYQDEYDPNEKFSLWDIEYNFPKDFLYYGLLPNRETGKQSCKYKRRGSGYYWQPEVLFLAHHYPDYINIKGGFVLNYERADFTKGIETLYELRKTLKSANDPLQGVLKLALASIYGKFCQHNGKSFYYNLFYAGFITSFVRAALLLAAHGQEGATISFAIDAIHTTAELDINSSDELSGWRLKKAASGIYFNNGVHRLYDENGTIIKEAAQGFKDFDFIKAEQQLFEKCGYEAKQSFFVGHNMSRKHPAQFKEKYLSVHNDEKDIRPLENNLYTSARIFDTMENEIADSKINDIFAGIESGAYNPSDWNDRDLAIQSLLAGRI